MKVCTTVFSYGGGIDIARRHLPIWTAHSDEVLMVFPEDSPAPLPGTKSVPSGRSNKYGEECLKRQLHGMRESLKAQADYYVFVEYDAFILRRPKPRPGVQANVFRNEHPHLQGPHFYHFPWIIEASALEVLAREATFEPFEKGFVDRWLQCQVVRLGIPVTDLRRPREGYSRNTIMRPREITEAVRLASRGGYAFHGVKDAQLLERIINASEARS
jgi:hypothetical protein